MTIVDKLTPLPSLPESYDKDGHTIPDTREPKPALTEEEAALFARASTFIQSALQRHGIGLSPKETPFIGAEVADFVVTELVRASESAKESAKPEPEGAS